MAKVILHNRHSAPIDGIAPGASGEFEDGPGVRRMVEIGHLSARAPETSAASASSDLEALIRANTEGAALVAKLEAENAALRAELEAARAAAPKGKGKKTDEPPAEG